MTLLLDAQKLYVYEGAWEEARAQKKIVESGYAAQSITGALIRQKFRRAGEGLTVVIKPLATASYENVIRSLDDMQINGVKKYAIVDPSADERFWVQTH